MIFLKTVVVAGLLGVACIATGANSEAAGAAKDWVGQVMTVNGPIAPSEVGMALTHEHIFLDYSLPLDKPELWKSADVRYPDTPALMALWKRKYSPDMNYELFPGWPENKDALRLDDYETAVSELGKYAALGGKTVVEVSTRGLSGDIRQLERLKQLSRDTGLNIIKGTGWYRDEWQPADVKSRSIDSLAEEMIHDITIGFGDSGIRAGIIGEIGAESHPPQDPLTENEIKVIRAAARAARATGVAVTLHTLLAAGDPLTVLDILQEEKMPMDRVVLGHINADVTRDRAYLKEIAKRGVYLEFDLLGYRESSARVTLLDDYEEAQAIVDLVHWGFGDRILLSHDVYSKMQLTKFGGYGYTFVTHYFLPALKELGLSQQQIEKIAVNNPRRILTRVAGNKGSYKHDSR